MCTIEVPLHDYSAFKFFLLDYPILRRIPHFVFARGVRGGEKEDVDTLKGFTSWCSSLQDGESTVYFHPNL